MTIKVGGKYRTRDGREAQVCATNGGDDYPVLGKVKEAKGWETYTWTSDGHRYDGGMQSVSDLIEVKPEHTLWMVVGPTSGYATREEAAREAAGCTYIPGLAVKRVTFTEGEGL